MAKKKTTSMIDDALAAAGFADTAGGGDQENPITSIDDIVNNAIITDDDKKPTDKPVEDNDKDNSDEGTTGPHDDNSDVPQDVINNTDNNSSDDGNDQSDVDDTDDDDDVHPDEAAQVGAFFDAFAEAMHWQVDPENKPDSIQGIIDYMTDLVETNSKPKYADPRIEQLDEYVKQGGSFDDFYNGMSQEIQYDSLDMEDESNQKTAVQEYLSLQGYSNDQIKSKIERYEDAGMLEDEANDAVERLKDIKKQQLEQQQAEQQAQYEEQQRQIQEFSTNLNNSINNLTSIRGINVPKEDRQALLDYITRVDENGQTQYQKDFNKNLVSNLIESAYFTMKGDTLLKEAQAKGNTDAVTKLRKILRHSTKNRTSQKLDDTKQSAIDIASKLFR